MSKQKHVTLGVAVLIALAATSAALSTPRGANGLIVYTQELRPNHYQLFTIRPDGSGVKQITHVLNVGNPDWSPSGNSIVTELESK